jgi:Trm5-related predicted tRNA methylase
VQRITRKFVDPELKRQTRQQQKQAEKAKLHRIIESMSEAEARAYLDERKARRAEEKGRVRAAMGSGQVFMIDLVFEGKMNEKENKSLTKQIELIMRAIKQF